MNSLFGYYSWTPFWLIFVVANTVAAHENRLVVELQKDILVPNDVKEEWVQTYEKETGEDISFFWWWSNWEIDVGE